MRKGVRRFGQVVISAVSHVDAPHIISSESIEAELDGVKQRLGIQSGLLEQVAGIKERRFWDVEVQPSEVAAQAGELAIERSRVKRDDIGIVVNTSVCRDYIEPSVASLVHHRLGLPSTALNYDLGNACLGFLDGMSLVAGLIELGSIDHGLVVDGESSRYAIEQTIARLKRPETTAKDFRDQFATLTLGSGAAAVMLSRQDLVDSNHHFNGGLSRAATEHSRLCFGQRDEMRTDTKALLKAGLQLAASAWQECVEEFQLGDGIAQHFIHQISTVHTVMLCQSLQIDLSTVPQIFPLFGNTGPASLPMVFAKELEKKSIKLGDRLCLMGMGSGLNCSAYEVVW